MRESRYNVWADNGARTHVYNAQAEGHFAELADRLGFATVAPPAPERRTLHRRA